MPKNFKCSACKGQDKRPTRVNCPFVATQETSSVNSSIVNSDEGNDARADTPGLSRDNDILQALEAVNSRLSTIEHRIEVLRRGWMHLQLKLDSQNRLVKHPCPLMMTRGTKIQWCPQFKPSRAHSLSSMFRWMKDYCSSHKSMKEVRVSHREMDPTECG